MKEFLTRYISYGYSDKSFDNSLTFFTFFYLHISKLLCKFVLNKVYNNNKR